MLSFVSDVKNTLFEFDDGAASHDHQDAFPSSIVKA
jgi:hypothetical protein